MVALPLIDHTDLHLEMDLMLLLLRARCDEIRVAIVAESRAMLLEDWMLSFDPQSGPLQFTDRVKTTFGDGIIIVVFDYRRIRF